MEQALGERIDKIREADYQSDRRDGTVGNKVSKETCEGMNSINRPILSAYAHNRELGHRTTQV